MEKGGLVIKGACIGIAIFIVAELIAQGYVFLIMRLIPSGSQWTPINALMAFSTKIVHWVCRPFSSIFFIFGRNLIKGYLILRTLDLLGWIGLSIIILHIRDEKKSSPAPK